jgi:hypothetical protein
MDLAMVKQEQGETLCKYMRHFFDKRATVVDVTNKEVIDLFQDGLYHRRTFDDFGHRRPISITKLKDMITSWADEEDKANAKYDAIGGKIKQNADGSNNNNNNNNNNNTTTTPPPPTTTTGIKAVATTTTRVPIASASQTTQRGYPAPCERQLEEDLRRLQGLAEREVPVAPGGKSHHRAVLPTPASTQGLSRPTTFSRQERQEKS